MQNEPGQQANGSHAKSAAPLSEATVLKAGLKPTAPDFKPQSRAAYV
jgi:hypothetical protein